MLSLQFLEAVTPAPLSNLDVSGTMSTIGEGITWVWNTIVGNPLLGIFCACSIVGIGVGFFRKLRH